VHEICCGVVKSRGFLARVREVLMWRIGFWSGLLGNGLVCMIRGFIVVSVSLILKRWSILYRVEPFRHLMCTVLSRLREVYLVEIRVQV